MSGKFFDYELQNGYRHHRLFIVVLGHFETMIINIKLVNLFWFSGAEELNGEKDIRILSTFMLDYIEESYIK